MIIDERALALCFLGIWIHNLVGSRHAACNNPFNNEGVRSDADEEDGENYKVEPLEINLCTQAEL
jgi:hypothetical protein